MEKEEALEQSMDLVNRSQIAIFGTNGEDGYPNMRAMIKAENEGLETIWFSTNTSSRKIPQLKKNKKACVYFVDFDKWMGLMLIGNAQIRQDRESRERLWKEGDEKYYPEGISDPDYSVIKFITNWGRYYHSLKHATFEL